MRVDLQKVRALFENRDNIEKADFLIREIARRLSERLSVIKMAPLQIMDAGCGCGNDLEMLFRKFPNAQITGLDASLAMLKHASRRVNKTGDGFNGVCGDFGQLPFKCEVFDMIWANLSLHWHGRMTTVFREWRQTLKPDGLLMFSCFGEGTWHELQKIYRDIDEYAHIAVFDSMHDIGNRLMEAGFYAPVLERERIEVTYPTVEKMLDEVRAFGGNPLSDRPKGLWGKKKYRQLLDWLNAKRDEKGLLTLDFEVIYAHAFAGDTVANEWKEVGIFRKV